jgi:hypothetical protein
MVAEPMMRQRLEYKIAILAALCTLAIFLFPGVSGPYSIVHGPVTALRAMRARLILLIGLMPTLLGLARLLRTRQGVAGTFTSFLKQIAPLYQSSTLRC